MDPGLLRDALTVVLGMLTGGLSGLFGVGGASISTPGIRALGAPALIAVGTTLPSIIPGAASGTARYGRARLIDGGIVARTAPVGVVAAVMGSLASEHVPGEGHLLMLLTAAVLGASALRMARQGPTDTARQGPTDTARQGPTDTAGPVIGPVNEVEADTAGTNRPAPSGDAVTTDGVPAMREGVAAVRASSPRLAGVGATAGLLSGLLGVGGGIIMVPGFSQLVRLPLKQAIATSLACVACFAIPGTITHALLGNIDWRFGLLLAVGVVPGALIGARLTIAADDHRLRLVVAVFLGLTAVVYAAGELSALIG